MRARFNIWKNGLSISLLLSIIFAYSSFASDASYIYDDAGRLIKVVSETGEVATYNYDAVGESDFNYDNLDNRCCCHCRH